jgi:hypothetical protein
MIAWPIARFQQIKIDLERHFMSVVDPEFGERVRCGEIVFDGRVLSWKAVAPKT